MSDWKTGNLVKVTYRENVIYGVVLSGMSSFTVTVSVNNSPVTFPLNNYSKDDEAKVRLIASGKAARQFGAKEALERAIVHLSEIAIDVEDGETGEAVAESMLAEIRVLVEQVDEW